MTPRTVSLNCAAKPNVRSPCCTSKPRRRGTQARPKYGYRLDLSDNSGRSQSVTLNRGMHPVNRGKFAQSLLFVGRDERLCRDHMKTALVIDDDATYRREMYRLLLEAGWRPLEAANGEDGVAMAIQHQPDLIICDLLVSQFNGFQLCRMLRAQRQRIRQPIIVVTSSSGYPTDRLNALEVGADRYLVKPFKQEALLRILEGDKLYETDLIPLRKQIEPPVLMPPAMPSNEAPLIRFWGVRGSTPVPGPSTVLFGGNTSCVEVRADGEIIILDAGSGIRRLGLALAREFQDQPISVTILITHTHWDHIQGFPFFGPAYNPQNKVRILGYEGARKGLLTTLTSQMESPYFPVSMRQLPSSIEVVELREFAFSIGRVQVEATFVNHPGLCLGYRLNTSGGSLAYLPDHESYQRMRSHSRMGSHADRLELVRHASAKDQKLIDFLEGTDSLIVDAQYDDQEYQSRVGWGHGCVDDVVALALLARARRLFLFHHDPDHDDSQILKMLAWARELVAMYGDTSLAVDAACEGFEFMLKGKPKTANSLIGESDA
jgi:phosphoribosyl 1,2-cyclic phosphodiesterase/ActR/RegA family two-component response regulator